MSAPPAIIDDDHIAAVRSAAIAPQKLAVGIRLGIDLYVSGPVDDRNGCAAGALLEMRIRRDLSQTFGLVMLNDQPIVLLEHAPAWLLDDDAAAGLDLLLPGAAKIFESLAGISGGESLRGCRR